MKCWFNSLYGIAYTWTIAICELIEYIVNINYYRWYIFFIINLSIEILSQLKSSSFKSRDTHSQSTVNFERLLNKTCFKIKGRWTNFGKFDKNWRSIKWAFWWYTILHTVCRRFYGFYSWRLRIWCRSISSHKHTVLRPHGEFKSSDYLP